jgi:hypothetical protein
MEKSLFLLATPLKPSISSTAPKVRKIRHVFAGSVATAATCPNGHLQFWKYTLDTYVSKNTDVQRLHTSTCTYLVIYSKLYITYWVTITDRDHNPSI